MLLKHQLFVWECCNTLRLVLVSHVYYVIRTCVESECNTCVWTVNEAGTQRAKSRDGGHSSARASHWSSDGARKYVTHMHVWQCNCDAHHRLDQVVKTFVQHWYGVTVYSDNVVSFSCYIVSCSLLFSNWYCWLCIFFQSAPGLLFWVVCNYKCLIGDCSPHYLHQGGYVMPGICLSVSNFT